MLHDTLHIVTEAFGFITVTVSSACTNCRRHQKAKKWICCFKGEGALRPIRKHDMVYLHEKEADILPGLLLYSHFVYMFSNQI